MRLRELRKLVEQVVASGGGGGTGGGFVPDWPNQVEVDPVWPDGPGAASGLHVYPAQFEGPRIVRVYLGIDMDPSVPGSSSGVDVSLRYYQEGVESDIDVCQFSAPYHGNVLLQGIIGDGASALLQANKNGTASEIPYLGPTRITEIPLLG